MISKALIFIISIVLTTTLSNAQRLELQGVRVGFDPIRSGSMLFKEKPDPTGKKPYYFNTWETSLELIGPFRTTFIAELGYTKAHLQEQSNTLDYTSHGHYYKIGLDFNATEPNNKYEFDIGWRLGINNFTESAIARVKGEYYGNYIYKSLPSHNRSMLWGEILFDYKQKLGARKNQLNGLWFNFATRLKFTNALPSPISDGASYLSYNIPGFGHYSLLSPGLTFGLTYYFKVKHKMLKELRHEHDNDIHHHHHDGQYHEHHSYHSH